MKYDKKSQTNSELGALLLQRGIEHPWTSSAEETSIIEMRFRNVAYYRLSGYWYPFLDENNQFNQGTTFEAVWERYTFDRKLRLLIIDAVERVEISIRAKVANSLSQFCGPFGYTFPQNLPGLNEREYSQFISSCINNYHRSRELYSQHFKETYGDEHLLPPIWMMVEMLEFGKLVTLYEGLEKSQRLQIASEYDTIPKTLTSWLKTLNDVRNMACHHARMWNRVFGRKPIIPRSWNSYAFNNDRLFSILTVLLNLMPQIAPSSTWPDQLLELLRKHPGLPLLPMGFKQGWENDTVWRAVFEDEDLLPLVTR